MEREYTVMTKKPSGATEAVTIMAKDAAEARTKVLNLGYGSVLWTQPER